MSLAQRSRKESERMTHHEGHEDHEERKEINKHFS